MADVFISYAREDRPVAEAIARAISRCGYTVWWDGKIPAGQTYAEVIERELGRARCVVVLWSRTSINREWVKNEAAEGAQRKILIPILIDDVRPPFEFRRIQAASLFNRDTSEGNPDFEECIAAIRTMLDQPEGSSPPKPAAVPAVVPPIVAPPTRFRWPRKAILIGGAAAMVTIAAVLIWMSLRREVPPDLHAIQKTPPKTATVARAALLEPLKFVGSVPIGTDAPHRIEDALQRYQARFAALGFHFGANQEVQVRIENLEAMKGRGMIAYYDREKNVVVVDERYASDEVVLREYTHSILMRANPRVKGTSNNDVMGLESGLADYFSRSFAGSPEYASFPGRTLVNDGKVFHARSYADVPDIGLAWGAFGWDLRTRLGRDAADALLLAAWEVAPLTPQRRFAQALVDADSSLNRGANEGLLRTLLAKRGVSR